MCTQIYTPATSCKGCLPLKFDTNIPDITYQGADPSLSIVCVLLELFATFETTFELKFAQTSRKQASRKYIATEIAFEANFEEQNNMLDLPEIQADVLTPVLTSADNVVLQMKVVTPEDCSRAIRNKTGAVAVDLFKQYYPEAIHLKRPHIKVAVLSSS